MMHKGDPSPVATCLPAGTKGVEEEFCEDEDHTYFRQWKRDRMF
jgi:hypothetical protein